MFHDLHLAHERVAIDRGAERALPVQVTPCSFM
jgi:hypothetical protein